jgi:hypothetical protein
VPVSRRGDVAEESAVRYQETRSIETATAYVRLAERWRPDEEIGVVKSLYANVDWRWKAVRVYPGDCLGLAERETTISRRPSQTLPGSWVHTTMIATTAMIDCDQCDGRPLGKVGASQDWRLASSALLAVPVVNRRDPRALRSAPDAAARAGGPC